MKKVININFQGRVIPIEESAYDILKQYVESLRTFFANEEGRDEIINDIEGRIAELFGETLKKGATCIADDDVNRIIDSMGRPEDFEGEEANVKSQLGSEEKQQQSNTQSQYEQKQNAYTDTASGPRRLYRDENNKVLGGVCSGVANYFNIDPVVVRILFLIFFFAGGLGFITYLIFWVVVPSSASKVIGSQRKRLFRDADDKVIGGVCSGLAQYFGISVWVPRLLFLIPFFSFVFRFGHWGWWDFPHFLSISFSPGSVFFYIILWLVVPEAKTAADKLEMKGEKVDLNNIKTTVQSDLEGFSKRAEQWGKEFTQKSKEWGKEFSQTVADKSKEFGSEAATAAKKHSRSLGDIIVMIFKIFAYFILGCVLFAIVSALFAFGVVMTGLIPAWSFFIGNGWQTILAWGTLILFIWVPVLGIVTYIIRRITGKRGSSTPIRFAFGGLWTIGWICVIFLVASVSEDFRYRNTPVEENVALAKPKVNSLEVRTDVGKYYDENWYRIEPFVSLDEDTAYVRNVRIRIVRAKNDSFAVTIVKLAKGYNRNYANEMASRINYDIHQQDSVLTLGKGIAINRNDKFRNQHVIITIAVPEGRKIMVNDNVGWDDNVSVNFGSNDWNTWGWDEGEGVMHNWNHNVWYIMTAKGLERVDKQSDDDNNDNNAVDDYRKSKEELQKQKEQKLKELQNIDKELDDKKADSSRYHYQPTAPQSPEKKTQSTAAAGSSYDSFVGMTAMVRTKFFF
ncbi:MAG: PspC domain-containing protein [Bacteroidota bacterium]|nr:PspC domain-containing protein [Bacteroidota bacterium]